MSNKSSPSLVLLGAAAAAGCTAGIILTSLLLRGKNEDEQRQTPNKSNDNNNVNQMTGKHAIPKELDKEANPYRKELELAVKLALLAGANMVKHCDNKGTAAENNLDLSIKGDTNAATDFCTAVDLANESLILESITSQFPGHKVIGEESTGEGDVAPLTKKPTWIVDPIDGTTNFASGLPLTCVSIGFCDGGIPVMGVAYAPITNELYIGVKGLGAFRNGVRINSTNHNNNTEKTLSNAVVCFEFGYARSEEGLNAMVGAVKHILRHGCRTTRTLGSGVLDLCYVASGRMDVVYTGMAEEGWKPWDYCASMVICEEAGCVMRTLKGSDDFDEKSCLIEGRTFDLYASSMVCGVNGKVVEECRRVVLGLK
mmetsp:Transcript_13446/g.19394  ORF Transcript_13446/g.19394 Transcript_13446/m.19394 type:complete len:370 (+) Transcript_13446:93-1202(+)|eukprot:CAMPEP_0195513334 /NCGR_PEP_ID=MMETSP0794_2-20130614/5014_1 /TAXON_ID=515487 /ORGANISM="Stephanopyxis turris, Strain CCMP 815" /LENGTH=369 /DNA_ID=CAMNT_0040641325 /DNA_START=80 /DNA_END=1189 /DNA_ORIENTATION=+